MWNTHVKGTSYNPFNNEACGSPRRNGGSREEPHGLAVPQLLVASLVAMTKCIIKQVELGRVMVAQGRYSPGRTLSLGWGRPGTGMSSHHIGICGAVGKHSVLSWLPWFLFFSV